MMPDDAYAAYPDEDNDFDSEDYWDEFDDEDDEDYDEPYQTRPIEYEGDEDED